MREEITEINAMKTKDAITYYQNLLDKWEALGDLTKDQLGEDETWDAIEPRLDEIKLMLATIVINLQDELQGS